MDLSPETTGQTITQNQKYEYLLIKTLQLMRSNNTKISIQKIILRESEGLDDFHLKTEMLKPLVVQKV